MIDENYGVAVQFDEDEEEVSFSPRKCYTTCQRELFLRFYKLSFLNNTVSVKHSFLDQEKEVDEIKEDSDSDEDEGTMETDVDTTLKGTVS